MTDNDKDILQDIRDRTIRLETKLDSLDEIKSEMKELHKVSDAAEQLSHQNALDIARLSGNITWVWRSLGGGAVTIVAGIVIWALQRAFQ